MMQRFLLGWKAKNSPPRRIR